MAKHPQHRHEHQEEEENGRGEFLADSAGQVKDFAMERFGKDDAKVIHCTKCHNAEKSEKLIKSTLLVSVCALLLSIASIALPYFNTVQFSPEEWELFLNKLGEPAEPALPAEEPAANNPKSAKPAVARSSATSIKNSAAAASVQSSVAVITRSSDVAVGGGVSSEARSSVATSESAPESSAAEESSAASETSSDAAAGDGTGAEKPGSL